MVTWWSVLIAFLKIATSRISPAWRSHSQRVLLSVHSEQLWLVGSLSSVLVPCVPKAMQDVCPLGGANTSLAAPQPVHVAHDTGACRHTVFLPSTKVTVLSSQHLVRTSRLQQSWTCHLLEYLGRTQPKLGMLPLRLRGQCRDDNAPFHRRHRCLSM